MCCSRVNLRYSTISLLASELDESQEMPTVVTAAVTALSRDKAAVATMIWVLDITDTVLSVVSVARWLRISQSIQESVYGPKPRSPRISIENGVLGQLVS